MKQTYSTWVPKDKMSNTQAFAALRLCLYNPWSGCPFALRQFTITTRKILWVSFVGERKTLAKIYFKTAATFVSFNYLCSIWDKQVLTWHTKSSDWLPHYHRNDFHVKSCKFIDRFQIANWYDLRLLNVRSFLFAF